MSIYGTLDTLVAQRKQADESAERICKRLETSGSIVQSINSKKQTWRDTSRHKNLAWASVWKISPDMLEITGDEEYPVTIKSGKDAFKVHNIFLAGNMWEICKYTRMLIAMERALILEKATISKSRYEALVEEEERRYKRQLLAVEKGHNENLAELANRNTDSEKHRAKLAWLENYIMQKAYPQGKA